MDVRSWGKKLMVYPRQKWHKLLFKMPLILWRMGLGPLMGHYVLVLTTWGRKSGLPRHVMTEYHVMRGRIYVPCAFGPKSQWYRNLAADPHVTVQTWQGAESMLAHRVTDDEELRAVYTLIRRRNPVMLHWYLESLGLPDDVAALVAHKDRVYIIRFDPTSEPTPPPLEVDLAWIWPVWMLLSAFRRWLSGKRSRRRER